MSQITYDTKVYIDELPDIPDINKVTADDMNEIKEASNNNDDMLTGVAIAGNMRVDSIQTKNMFDKYSIVAGDIITASTDIRLSSRQRLWLDAGTYTFSCSNLTTPFRYVVQVQNVGTPPLSTYPSYILDSGWRTTSSYTFTISTGGWVDMVFSKENNAELSIYEVLGFNWQLEKGDTATAYKPYQNLNNSISFAYPKYASNRASGDIIVEKCGRVVNVVFRDYKVNANISNEIIASGLPVPISSTWRFGTVYSNTGTVGVKTVLLTATGQLTITMNSADRLEGSFTYIAEN